MNYKNDLFINRSGFFVRIEWVEWNNDWVDERKGIVLGVVAVDEGDTMANRTNLLDLPFSKPYEPLTDLYELIFGLSALPFQVLFSFLHFLHSDKQFSRI